MFISEDLLQPPSSRWLKTADDVTISRGKLASIFPTLGALQKGKGGKAKWICVFQKGNIPKNRTPFLFLTIFSSGASHAAQFRW